MRLVSQRRSEGFTLIEMMISVAIIGILAAIAIPAFRNYQYRSRRAEAYGNLAALSKSEKAYFSEYSAYVETAPMPGPPLSAIKRVWTPAAELEYSIIGWRPEGPVYYDYEVNVTTGGGCPVTLDCFTATAYGDADGDTSLAVISYVQPNASGVTALDSIYQFPVPANPTTGTPRLNEVAVNYAADLY